jgi:hypothetical protein
VLLFEAKFVSVLLKFLYLEDYLDVTTLVVKGGDFGGFYS